MDDMKRVTLRRYTNLAAAIHLFRRKKITLLNPSTWDDRNDAYFLELYRKKKRLGSVLAACFTETAETYHHWRVFSPGNDGVCLHFNKSKLVASLQQQGVQFKKMDYQLVDEFPEQNMSIDDLPFVKRRPYEDEQEFRALFESPEVDLSSVSFSIQLECVTQIDLSPWLHVDLSDAIKETLRTIDGCAHVRLNRSQLVDFERWKNAAAKKFPVDGSD